MIKRGFEVEVYCTTGFDDEEEIGALEVDSLSEIFEAHTILEKVKERKGLTTKENELYEEMKERMKTESGEDVVMTFGIRGIRSTYGDSSGVTAVMVISDEEGVDGVVKIDKTEFGNNAQRVLNEVKNLSDQISKTIGEL